MIFQRALRREILSTAGAVFTILFTIIISKMLIQILGQAAGGKVAPADVIALIGFTVLSYLPLVLILTGFIAVLWTVTRAYQDSEMVVWFASGLSLGRWLQAIIWFALPLAALVGFLAFIATPWANRHSTELREQYEKREDISKISPGQFQESSGSNRIFFVESVAGAQNKVQNVFVNTVDQGISSVIVAKEGTIEIDPNGDKFVVMTKGRRYDGLPIDPEFQMMQFERYGILAGSQSKSTIGERSAKAMPLGELLNAPTPINLGELLWRCALPIMSIVLILLAVPLGYVNPRVGRSANLIAALLLVSLYVSSVNIMQASVVNQTLPFLHAIWPVHAAAVMLTCAMFAWRVNVNSRIHPLVMWATVRASLRKKENQ